MALSDQLALDYAYMGGPYCHVGGNLTTLDFEYLGGPWSGTESGTGYTSTLTASAGSTASWASVRLKSLALTVSSTASLQWARAVVKTIYCSTGQPGVAFVKAVSRSFAATAGATATWLRGRFKEWVATAGSSSSLVKAATHALATSSTALRAWVKSAAKTVSASTTPIAWSVRQAGKVLTRSVSSSASWIGDYTSGTKQLLWTASGSATASLVLMAGKVLTASSTAVGAWSSAVTRLYTKVVTATATGGATIVKVAQRIVGAQGGGTAWISGRSLAIGWLYVSRTVGDWRKAISVTWRTAIASHLASWSTPRTRWGRPRADFLLRAAVGAAINPAIMVDGELKLLPVASAELRVKHALSARFSVRPLEADPNQRSIE